MTQPTLRMPRSSKVTDVVERSAPNPDRPKLPDEYERQLNPGDRERAKCYAEIEHLTDRMRRIADVLADDVKIAPTVQAPAAITVEQIATAEEEWEDDSLVSSVEAFRRSTQKGETG